MTLRHIDRWPVDGDDDSWLTRWVYKSADAVIITLRVSPTYHQPRIDGGTVGWYDTGGWVNVQLSEPLRSRKLIDGSTLVEARACMLSSCK